MMSATKACLQCRELLDGNYEGDDQPQRIDSAQPGCACEQFSVGVGSPGLIEDNEILYRLVISPGDVDQHGTLLMISLDDVRSKGLSVFRECATDEDIVNLVSDRLTRKSIAKPRKVEKMIRIKALDARLLTSADIGRLYCIYDEVVPRKFPEYPRITTHGTMLQRMPVPGTENRKGISKKNQEILFNKFILDEVDILTFRNGIIADLNDRSLSGDFVYD